MRPGLNLFPSSRKARYATPIPVEDYWSLPAGKILQVLGAQNNGLTERQANMRLMQFGPNTLNAGKRATALSLLASQFKSPLVLILVVASAISLLAKEWVDAAVVLVIVFGSTMLGFAQEYIASHAIEKLRSQMTILTCIMRNDHAHDFPSEQIVQGDVVLLSAGSLIPADGIVLEAKDCFVNQAVLTGETFPVEKQPGIVSESASLIERTNCVFMGSSVSSGTARMLVVKTGKETMFGQIAAKLALRPAVTEFERGVQHFGYLLTRIMLVMVTVVLAINILMDKPAISSLLFALALSVGLTPELLPAIISITLSHGAKRMAKLGVIVRRLNSIENLGSMDVLCTDKTGTLTQGVVELDHAYDVTGTAARNVLRLAAMNATFQNGLVNPLDEAIKKAAHKANITELAEYKKIDEIPYDFVRKCLSVVVADASGARTLITKGALTKVLALCTQVADTVAGSRSLDQAMRMHIELQYDQWSSQGYRVLGLATRAVAVRDTSYTRLDESQLCFAGFLLFFDPPKEDVCQTIADLAERGVNLKIITGDNRKVAQHVAQTVGLQPVTLMTGSEMHALSDEALLHAVGKTTIFAEVDPNQKERIILALQKTGHVVGYMGDGINDALALQAADVGLSVNTAVDVAKDAADFVLLQKDLRILREGIDEGRRAFANTLKYVLTTISANFGNMFSMAIASVCLPFLPLLASQILLNNFLSDMPATAIAGDKVDQEWMSTPHRWNTGFIRNYMVVFGLLSSVFDFLTFGTLIWIFQAEAATFRTGWFLESLLTELVIALVVRTRRPFWRSRPANLLLMTTAVVMMIALLLPYLPVNALFGFVPLPLSLVISMIVLTMAYVLAVEITKKIFYSRMAGT